MFFNKEHDAAPVQPPDTSPGSEDVRERVNLREVILGLPLAVQERLKCLHVIP